MAGLDWLTARPVAHRGLHDALHGVIENTASAFAAAIANGYAIECDLRLCMRRRTRQLFANHRTDFSWRLRRIFLFLLLPTQLRSAATARC
jgi:glycerophosphoryl diester phosphodiesterase